MRNMSSNRCLIANTTWRDVRVIIFTFNRCTFRNYDLEDASFVDCNFNDVDFIETTIRNTPITNTRTADTSIDRYNLVCVSWGTNAIHRCIFDGFISTGSLWDHMNLQGVGVSDYYTESNRAEHAVNFSSCSSQRWACHGIVPHLQSPCPLTVTDLFKKCISSM